MKSTIIGLGTEPHDIRYFLVEEAWLRRVTPKLAATSVPLVAKFVEHKKYARGRAPESEGVTGDPSDAAVKLGVPGDTSIKN